MGKTVAAWLMVAGAIGAPATGPRETVETAVVRVVEVLQQSDGPDRAQDNRAHDNQRAEIKRIARALFDFDEIARRALSRHWGGRTLEEQDRKSTRLNSSHGYISYAVFCLKKKKTY